MIEELEKILGYKYKNTLDICIIAFYSINIYLYPISLYRRKI